MEHSRNSSMKKSLSSKGAVDSPEESGWTTYFEDFLSNNREDSSCSSGYNGCNSLASDAASCAAWNFPNNNHALGHISELGLGKSGKKLKRRTRRIIDDDALEDTASSPVNSPKAGGLKQFDMNQGKKDDNINSSQEKGSDSGYYSELQKEDRNHEVSFIGRDTECTELKKRGLCLVPMSMLVNYFG